MNRTKTDGVQPAVVAFIVLVVAVVSFVAGQRMDGWRSFGDSLSNSSSSDLPDNLDYTSVERLYDTLKIHFDGELSVEDLLDGLKRGLVSATGDSYTVYLNAEQAKQFNDDLNGSFEGIGAEIGKQGEFVTVVAPLKGFPAEKAGIKAGDIILEIDGEDTVGLSIEEAVFKIRGQMGTQVNLTIIRGNDRLEFDVTREKITIPSVSHEIKGGIGILNVYRFSDTTPALVRQAHREFIEANVTQVVLDLRGNTGGFVGPALEVAGFWIDEQLITEQRSDKGTKVTESHRASAGALFKDFETVVLINGGTASASEIVAGALQDYELATIVGTPSFGKGSIQSLERLDGGALLKVTIAHWYTPKGRNFDTEGLKPDVEIEFDEEADNDNQLDEAIKLLSQ